MKYPAVATFAMLLFLMVTAVMGRDDGRPMSARMDLRALCSKQRFALSREGTQAEGYQQKKQEWLFHGFLSPQ